MVNDDTYGTQCAAAAAAQLHRGMLHAAAAHAGSGNFSSPHTIFVLLVDRTELALEIHFDLKIQVSLVSIGGIKRGLI